MAKEFLLLVVLTAITHHSLAADCKKIPTRINPTICCPIPELITDENSEKCKVFLIERPTPTFVPMSNENPPTAKRVKPLPTPAALPRNGLQMQWCFLDCILNNTGIMENGKFNEANLSSHLKKVLKDTPEFIPELEKSFKTCSPKVEKHHLKMAEKIKNIAAKFNPPVCTPKNSHLMACVFTETFINCPAKYWNKSKECSELRDHMKNCSPKPDNSKEESLFSEEGM